MWDKFGKRTRLVAGDTGGFDTMGSLVDEGIVIPFVVANDPYPIETLDKVAQGYWPDDKGFLVSPGAPSAGGQDIGLYVFEGLTSFGDIMMRHLSHTKKRLSQDPAYTYVDGKTEFSGTNMSYYGEIQNRIYDFVVKSSMLPVERVIWTALEGRGEEEGTKSPTYGPSIVGKKSTGKAGQWFGNMIHLEMLVTEVADPATKQINHLQRRVMYIQPHADVIAKIPFPAKVRVPFDKAGEFSKAMGGQPYMDPPDLGKLYDLLESMKGAAAPKEAISATTAK
jgi:hypothetical protein